MNCPLCNLEGRISKMIYKTVNDDTAEKKTELHAEQEIICVNEKCENFNKVFETVVIPMELG